MDNAAQNAWLTTHIPHRIRAVIARLPLQEELLKSISAKDPQKIKERCEGNSIWEGRLVAVRWLIEFIGVTQDKNGKPVRPKRRNPTGADVSIERIAGGALFDLQSSDAIVLARVWKGCSQASSHATHASGHPPVDEVTIDSALRIVIAHLDRTIYATQPRKVASASLHLEKQ